MHINCYNHQKDGTSNVIYPRGYFSFSALSTSRAPPWYNNMVHRPATAFTVKHAAFNIMADGSYAFGAKQCCATRTPMTPELPSEGWAFHLSDVWHLMQHETTSTLLQMWLAYQLCCNQSRRTKPGDIGSIIVTAVQQPFI
jgi:hypothetical protein